MADETDFDSTYLETKRSGAARFIFVTVFFLLIVLLAIAYWQRINLADRLVRDQLAKYGVDASYEIKDIGLRTQRIENLIIGDPRAPDLKAKWVEVDVSINFSGATPRDVRASGVRLNGAYKNGKLSFGELDKFSDPDSKEPFMLPDIGLDIVDASARLETPWGIIGAALDGNGLLRQGFEGNLAIRSPVLTNADCTADDVRFDGRYLLDFRQPNLIGPMSVRYASCKKSQLSAKNLSLNTNARLSATFDSWLGDVGFAAADIRAPGVLFGNPRGSIKFDGNKSRTNFEAKLANGSFGSKPLTVRNLAASGKGALSFANSGWDAAARGDVQILNGALNRSYLDSLEREVRRTKGLLFGPLTAKIVPALGKASENFDVKIRYDGNLEEDGGTFLKLDRLVMSSRSGASLVQSGTAEIYHKDKVWRLQTPVSVAISGGDLPRASLAFNRADNKQVTGDLQFQEYRSGDASLAISNLSFAGKPGGAWTFDGRAILSGPIQGGSIRQVNIPIDARWYGANFALFQKCQNVAFESIRYSTVLFSAQSIRLCPNEGSSILQAGPNGARVAASIPNLSLNATVGGERLKTDASNVRFNLAEGITASNIFAEYGNSRIRAKAPSFKFSFTNGFVSKDVNIEIGKSGEITRFDIASIFGRPTKGGFAGRLEGANGEIVNVPLILDEAAGNWTFSGGKLALDGSLRVNDAEQVDRFKPLNVPNALVTYENGIINALGSLYEPTKNRKVAETDIRHVLSSGTGGALLSVSDLRFGADFGPELITPLTLGVIANTVGTINGEGRINWGPNGVKSTGRFVTESLNTAAAFGPVEGLSTEIVFNDLLGFETGPGQIVKIASVNPGIAALNGQIRYQILPGKRIRIEGGTWPFAGGSLILEPTILDFALDKERRLTFRVEGLDAAQFLQTYDFQNLQVSGIFDGTLPMVFNQEGGRIVGGSLVSRPGGGQVSYVGELSYEDIGVFANFAFNALKSIRYNELEIGVAGDIDGEIVTEVKFAGLQQGTSAKRNFITKQLAKIPIQFNVTVRAQFLQLIGSIRSVYDAEYARDQGLPFLLDRQRGVPPITGEEKGDTKDE
jgi:translocation and assembly module TamB